MKVVYTVLAIGFLTACGATEPTSEKASSEERAFVITSDEAGIGGLYSALSPTGEAVSDLDGNLVENVMRCGFVDVRVVDDPEALHGSGFAIWVSEVAMTDIQQQCLKEELPQHARVSGPTPVSELKKRAGL